MDGVVGTEPVHLGETRCASDDRGRDFDGHESGPVFFELPEDLVVVDGRECLLVLPAREGCTCLDVSEGRCGDEIGSFGGPSDYVGT